MVLAQAHGGPFWVGWMESFIWGWGLSVFLEVSSLWLWALSNQNWKTWVAKLAITAVLLFGLIAQSAQPLLISAATSGQLGEYQTVIKKLAGKQWVNQKAYEKKISANEGKLPEWFDYLKAVVAAVVFPVLYAVVIIAVIKVFRPEKPLAVEESGQDKLLKAVEKVSTRIKPLPVASNNGKELIEKGLVVARRVELESGLTQAELAKRYTMKNENFAKFLKQEMTYGIAVSYAKRILEVDGAEFGGVAKTAEKGNQ